MEPVVSDILAVKAHDSMNKLCLSITYLSVHVWHSFGFDVLCNTLINLGLVLRQLKSCTWVFSCMH